MTTFNFNSRETYLAYVAKWKQDYKYLSDVQREEKKLLKQQMREGVYAWKLQASILARKYEAFDMIQERLASKVEANRQYLEAKSVSTCAG